MHRLVFLFAFNGLLLFNCVAQTTSSSPKKSFFQNTSIGSKFYYGSFLTTKAKAEYVRDSYSSFAEIFIQHQTNGSNDWEVTHRYPQWGIAFLHGNTGSKQYIGYLNSIYAYMNIPVISSKTYTGSLLIGAGPGWISKPFDINTNPKNTLIGTRLNAYINLVLQNEIRIAKQVYFQAGIQFMHLSNGGTTLPNLGLNTPGVMAGLRYAFDEPVIVKDNPPARFTRSNHFSIYTTVAFKQAPWIGGNYYFINNLQAEASRRVSRNYSVGAGTLISYNRSLDYFPLENPDTEKRNKKKLQAGLYASYEHFFGKLSIPLHLGMYVYNKNPNNTSSLFQEFGLRYRCSKHISAELILKSHMGQADFIHTGIGYNF